MTADPTCCTPDTSLEAIARLMVDLDCGAIPVVGDLAARLPVGMITDRDIVIRTLAAGLNPFARAVRDCMTMPAITVIGETLLADVLEILEMNQIRRMIVVDHDGRCCGIISQADIAQCASRRTAGELVHEVSHRFSPLRLY
jgi:CBS domain-containing protein